MSRRKRKLREFKSQQRVERNYLQVIEGGQPVFKKREKQVNIVPRNFNQDNLLGMLENPSNHIVFAIGPAGTGKTLISTLYAIRSLKAGECDKIVITRPAVSVDEQHGFLPGSLVEKMAPWTRPIFDIFEEYYAPKEIEAMLEDGVIEVAPLSYMRGRTFKNSVIIADEMQNATDNQMMMLLTRIGDNSKLVVTGDLAQHDRGFESNGLKMFLSRLGAARSKMIRVLEFDRNDIERHPVVDEVLKIYNQA